MPSSFGAWVRAARVTFPSLPMDEAAFARHLQNVADAKNAARAPELFLAFSCARAQPAALAAFEREVLPASLRAVRLPPDVDVDELRQMVRERLLVASKGSAAKIGTYAGSGSLVAWVATVASRAAVDLSRKRGTTPHDDIDDVVLQGDQNTELEYLKRHYALEFKQAFRRVLDALPREDRRLLKLCYLEGLTADVVARMLGVHRLTVSRHLVKLRETLADETRKGLAQRLGVKSKSLESVMKLMDSRMDASIRRALDSKP